MSKTNSGMAMVLVITALATALVFASFILTRSVNQGHERIASVERGQLDLMCLSLLEAAKLKIKSHPTELYTAFKYMLDEPVAARDNTYYETFIADLRLDRLDASFAVAYPNKTARVESIERLGVTQQAGAMAPGYVEDYFRINVVATSQNERFAGGLESEMRMSATIQMIKMEDR